MLSWLLAPSVVTALFVAWRYYYFLRDPKRTSPAGENLIVAPADGRVTYVTRVEAGQVPIAIKGRNHIQLTEITGVPHVQQDGWLIGIFMSPFSVHQNRLPVSGRVVLRRHTHAPKNVSMVRMFTNLFIERKPYAEDCHYLVTNERLTVGIQTQGGAVVTATQIADSWVDRIVAHVSVGDECRRGDKYGLIRLGSQVDTFIPARFVDKIAVVAGERVRAGETILAVGSAELAPVPKLRTEVRQATPEDGPQLLELGRRNPMVMDVTAVTDRGPDYFKLHRALPGSTAWVASEGAGLLVGGLSLLALRGRVGDEIIPLGYGTDLVRDPQSKNLRALARVLDIAIKHVHTHISKFLFFGVNTANTRMMKLAGRRLGARFATLEYVDVVPTRRRKPPPGVTFRALVSTAELEPALALLDAHHSNHQLYEPWTVERFDEQASRLPNFGRQNVIGAFRDGKLIAVAVYYDPKELMNLRVLAYDRPTAVLSILIGALHKLTGLMFMPPAIGASVATLQVRRFAGDKEGIEAVLDHICNLAVGQGIHSVSYVEDPRHRVPVRRSIVLRYRFDLFSIIDSPGPNVDTSKPLFFDITFS
jgi:phosphatidylserine decarboxylase